MRDNNMPMEEITSSSKKTTNNPITAYADGIYNNLGNVIKVVAFIQAFVFIILGFVLAFLIFSKTSFSISIGLGLIIAFTLIAAFVFFPTYAIGQVLCQNNEILKKLNEK